MFPFYVCLGAGVAVAVCNPCLLPYHLSAFADPYCGVCVCVCVCETAILWAC